MILKKILLLSFITLSIFTQGCTTKKYSPMYFWGSYELQLYHYYKNDKSIPDQITTLNKTIEYAKENNMPVPPGLHAHLGYLYSLVGDKKQAIKQFNIEKEMFPESKKFVNYLIKNLGKKNEI